MLVIVPYLVQHPGTELAEAARVFDVRPGELRDDLDAAVHVRACRRTSPGDLIEVDIEEDGRIYISMADHFSRPLRLTRNEALALYLRGTELLATPGLPEAPALARRAGQARVGARPRDARRHRGRASRRRRRAARSELAADAPRGRRAITSVCGSSTSRIRRGEWSTRRVDPEEVFSSLGNWYVAAWDVDADGERLFRADRIRRAEPVGERFAPRGLAGAGRALYTPTRRGRRRCACVLGPQARWIAEYYATDGRGRAARRGPRGHPAHRAAGMGRGAVAPGRERRGRCSDPPELAERVRDLAARHGGGLSDGVDQSPLGSPVLQPEPQALSARGR